MKPKLNFFSLFLASFLGLAILSLFLPLNLLAQGLTPIPNPDTAHLVNIPDFGQLLVKIIQIFLAFAGAIAVVFLMVGGFQYVASRGNEEGVEKAKKAISAAIIGLVIIVMAYAIVTIINTLLTQPPPQ